MDIDACNQFSIASAQPVKHTTNISGDYYSSHVNTDVTIMGMHLQKVWVMLWYTIEGGIGQQDRKSIEQKNEK